MRVSSLLGVFLGCGVLVMACGSELSDDPDADCRDARIGMPCSVGVGVCQQDGTMVCGPGGIGAVCSANASEPVAERCNDLDDDCDGQVDESFVDLGQPCEVGVGGCMRVGVRVCVPGTELTRCDASPGEPTAELCDGSDEDCDGQVDEGFDLGATCQVGVGACQREGVIACDAGTGAASCSATPGEPSAELCNQVDDDCNGTLDDVVGIGDACTANAPGVCVEGHRACGDGELVCVPGEPQLEICNNVDDNCDGATDEEDPDEGTACDTGQPGVCSSGTRVCIGTGQLVCLPNTDPSPELCNGDDEDCDGAVDDACVPLKPRPLSLWNGVQTGSPWVPAGASVTPLQPRFRWRPVMGAVHYDLQVDDSCPAADFRNCAFPSPEIHATVTATSFQPPQPLSVATVPPVGRRYFWRVRACNASGCSAFSEPRYLDVGRVAGDVNGDGYPDLIVGSSGEQSTGRVLLYLSGAQGVSTSPAVVLAPPSPGDELFRYARIVGDLNNDGFADVVVGVPDHAAYRGIAYLYYGSQTGLPTQPSRVLASPLTTDDFFGQAVFGPGDVDGDGDADLVIGAFATDRAYLYLGDPAGVAAVHALEFLDPYGADSSFGGSGGSLGDIDGDGYADFAIGASSEPGVNPSSGAVFVYRGSASGPAATPSQEIRNTVDPNRIFFGRVIRGGFDLDGDGLADAVLGPATGLFGTPYPNAIYIHRGSDAGLVIPPIETIRSPRQAIESFAEQVALGDVDGDGDVDLLTGDPLFTGPGVNTGLAEVFYGTAGPLGPLPDQQLPNPTGQSSALFGRSVALCDFNADGYDERLVAAVRQDHPASGEGAVYIYAGSPAPTTMPEWELDSPTNQANGAYGVVLSCGR